MKPIGPARDSSVFPIIATTTDANNVSVTLNGGLTLRDYFAAAALQGQIACNSQHGTFLSNALDAYAWSDAMLRARTMTEQDAT